ncbi:MAG: ATP phosphoribosyltransferase [Bifidobacteriaceae bacterium]|jgi:ATP phosphoribosyltransferase|nr:ATP phosphoribosyltransferase [Bifidobacteriaceae bacterium]
MLRIAVPNKGSLSEPAVQMLRDCGYAQRREARELVLMDPAADAEFFYLRPRDIAVYVGSGTVDAGVTGRDLLLDSGAAAVEHLGLGFGRSTFRFAARPGWANGVGDLAGKRVATSYPVLVGDHLRRRGIDAQVVRLDGAVESAIQLGVADAIADVVSTGTTLRAAGLAVFGEPLLESEAVLIRRRDGLVDSDGLARLTRRLQGVLVASQYVLMDYDVPIGAVERAVSITPGLESPTVSPLHSKGWAAVRAVVPAKDTNELMDRLYEVGARGILVTEIKAARI